ncbi:TPM domain-containing protein [Solimonas variicoloris]|uniref:TPM domain-containing protein n=1 Tax=Solimonas variicoloris TaxID=254408 RepID=UPI0003668F57|nr:TPM domain-containing protein [Solimonas variicoloris]
MDWARLIRHLTATPWRRRRCFPPQALAAIEAAVRACESRHAGEIRFAVETALPLHRVWAGLTPRERAAEVFAQLRVWDTEHNNGVLIYVLLADRDVEIVADRGVGNARVPAAEWQACCQLIEAQFHAGRYAEGACAGIAAVAEVLARHPPARRDAGNELPDAPVLL